MKNLTFFEQCEKIKLEVTNNLIKKMERKHEWKRLAELVKYREELKGNKKDQTVAAGVENE